MGYDALTYICMKCGEMVEVFGSRSIGNEKECPRCGAKRAPDKATKDRQHAEMLKMVPQFRIGNNIPIPIDRTKDPNYCKFCKKIIRIAYQIHMDKEHPEDF